jgi:hypothetical protein
MHEKVADDYYDIGSGGGGGCVVVVVAVVAAMKPPLRTLPALSLPSPPLLTSPPLLSAMDRLLRLSRRCPTSTQKQNTKSVT